MSRQDSHKQISGFLNNINNYILLYHSDSRNFFSRILSKYPCHKIGAIVQASRRAEASLLRQPSEFVTKLAHLERLIVALPEVPKLRSPQSSMFHYFQPSTVLGSSSDIKS
jgi:hypothetical protein